MKPSLRMAGVAAAVAAVTASFVAAAADASAAPTAYESCASGSKALTFGAAEKRVLLRPEDGERVADDIVARYPMVAQDDNRPQRVVLWQRPGGDWVFVGLRIEADRPAGHCYTATFSAARFAITPSLLQRYFAIRG